MHIRLLQETIQRITGIDLKEYDLEPKTIKIKHGINVITNPDFDIKFDYEGSYATLIWIHNKTNIVKGKELFKALIDYFTSLGIKEIGAWGTKGKVYGVDAIGYYIMLKWGFVPDDMSVINNLLGTHYKSFEEALKDPEFLKNWKIKGNDYFGTFNLTPGSLSWKLFNNG